MIKGEKNGEGERGQSIEDDETVRGRSVKVKYVEYVAFGIILQFCHANFVTLCSTCDTIMTNCD